MIKPTTTKIMSDLNYQSIFSECVAAAEHEARRDSNYSEDWGACGFAWVKIRPGTSKLARAAKKYAGASKSYNGGVDIWVSFGGQSVSVKKSYANAYARKLSELTGTGENQIYGQSRLD